MYTIQEDYKVYKNLEYVKVNGDTITDDKFVGCFKSIGDVVDAIYQSVMDYLVKTMYITKWNACDFWIEQKGPDGKYRYKCNIEGQIDNEKRNIVLNFPLEFTYYTTPELRKVNP